MKLINDRDNKLIADAFAKSRQEENRRGAKAAIEILRLIIPFVLASSTNVVCCKHCRKWTNGDDINGTCNWNEYQTLQTRFDDFCSYGEKKEEV